MMLRKKLYLFFLVLALVIPTTLVYAAIDSVTLYDGTTATHQVDLLSIEQDAPNTTYTYAITGINGIQNGVSHWVLGIESCLVDEFLVSPTAGSNYETPTDLAVCDPQTGSYNCLPATYSVEEGTDGSTGLFGLKFNIVGEGLKDGETHIFEITVKDVIGEEQVHLLTKFGGTDTGGDETITGPACPGTTAVTLSSNNVSSPASSALLPMALTLVVLLLATASIVVWRKRVTS